MEEWNDFDLLHVGNVGEKGGRGLELTISEPTPPLNILPPPEYTSCDIIQLT
jgi:hypothetical protein